MSESTPASTAFVQDAAAKLRAFMQMEASSGILLFAAAAFALALSNSPFRYLYDGLLATHLSIQVGESGLDKPLLLWINDGLMAVFFTLVGLEVKREILSGSLSSPRQILLPAVAAAGGLVVPCLIFFALNRGDAEALQGWAVPAATDIAFAMGVVALLGDRVPEPLKIFLMSLAIFDDLAAICIIALFYTDSLSLLALGISAACVVVLAVLNRCNVRSLTAYFLVGIVMWVSVLKSGVHATLAGVVLAFFIPLRTPGSEDSPLEQLETTLHPWVAWMVLPVFAFANAGVSLAGIDIGDVTGPVALGVAAGLFIGKQVGVFLASMLAIRLGIAELPGRCRWSMLYGVALLTGIGFTMSLFIGGLAYEHGGFGHLVPVRVGVFVGSIASGIAGYLVLRAAAPATQNPSVD